MFGLTCLSILFLHALLLLNRIDEGKQYGQITNCALSVIGVD